MRCEILLSADLVERGSLMLQAMLHSAPASVRVIASKHYRGDCQTLMTYGLGHPVRRAQWQAHLAAGGRVIGWDLGYWDRKAQTMRLSIDADHPQAWLRPEAPERWRAAGIGLRNDHDPDGPLLICGMGRKSRVAFSATPLGWELGALAKLRAAYPGRRIIYRPKKEGDAGLPGLPIARGSIEDAIRGAALVVCRHSNVAVDACIAGVPVVCDDGAASKIYGNDVSRPSRPNYAERLAFLESLAFWQWKPIEAGSAWKYLQQRLGG